MLEFTIDLVAEQPCLALGAEFDYAIENLARHQRAGRIVRRIDVDQARVGAHQPFKRRKIVGPT